MSCGEGWVGEGEVALAVSIAEIANECFEQGNVSGQFPLVHFRADQFAKNSAKVFVAWVGEEAPAISEKSDEVRKQSEGGDGFEVCENSLPTVIEPPGGPQLDFARHGTFAKGAGGGSQEWVVAGVEGVEDGLGEHLLGI